MKLRKPITAHGSEVSEIVLKAPTALQCKEIGLLPYRVDDGMQPQPLLAVSCRYIAVCGGIPPSSVDQLDVADLNALAWEMVGFFMGSASATSES